MSVVLNCCLDVTHPVVLIVKYKCVFREYDVCLLQDLADVGFVQETCVVFNGHLMV